MRNWFRRLQFWTAIVGGLLVLLSWLILVQTPSCGPPGPKNVAEQSDKQSDGKQGAANQPDHAVTEQEGQQPNSSQPGTAETYAHAPAWICDAKATDLFLVYFTYCLVIVGAFAIRSQEEMVKQSERPLVFPHFRPQVGTDQMQIIVSIMNSGKTPAMLKEIAAKFTTTEPWWFPRYVTGDRHNFDVIVPPEPQPSLTVPFRRAGLAGVYFVGYVAYNDIFGAKHQSRFCVLFEPDATELRSVGPRRLNSYS